MGGVFVKRKDQLARPLYDFTIDTDTGELNQSYYDEEPTKSIKGMLLGNTKVITRFLKWTKLAFLTKSEFNLEFCQ